MIMFMCRNNKKMSTYGASLFTHTLYISSRTLETMERIITTIKDMESSLQDQELPPLRRLLYRSMDVLKELELNLAQLKVEKSLKSTQ